MPYVASPSAWPEVAAAFAVLAAVAFLVTWVITDLLHTRRTPYIAILLLAVAGLSAAYVAWSDVAAEALRSNPVWGAVAGVLAAAVLVPLVRKLPARPHATGARLGLQLLWEGGAYGLAEALLLATLPVLVTWQGVPDAAGAFGWQRIGWGALCVLASLVVILVHHLGYAEFRAPSGRTKLLGALLSCGLQALAFLLTGSILAPVLAHVLLHVQMVMRGVEMPPARRPEDEAEPMKVQEAREPVGV